jgi:putative transcriptional regulator
MIERNGGRLFEDLRESLREAQQFREGKVRLRTTAVAEPDAVAIRAAMGLTQQEFAALIGVSARTLQNWEQGHRRPRGPARALLIIAQADPRAALHALHALHARHGRAERQRP